MKTVLLLLTISALSKGLDVSGSVRGEWELFKKQHSKSYASETVEQFRKNIYLSHKRKIAQHYLESPKHGLQLGMNKHGCLLYHEVLANLQSFQIFRNSSFYSSDAITYLSPHNVKIPESIDWRKLGAVTNVKWDGLCGASWAFAATGSLESQQFRKTGKLVSLSAQNLVDCSSSYGNKGCNGGSPENAFMYIKENHGIDTAKSYPYKFERKHAGRCHYRRKHKGADVKGYVTLPFGDETKLKEAVATVGPISVVIDGSLDSFCDFYAGIYFDKDCSSTNLNTGAVVVGYGTEEGQDYWLLKCSMTYFFGDDGYIKIARNKNNTCGIASSASYPLV